MLPTRDGDPVVKDICLDFDGVIHSYTTPWRGVMAIPDSPVPGAFEFIEEALEYGFRVSVFSVRSLRVGGIYAMKEWFRRHGCPENVVSSLLFPDHKPGAVIYIDDRAFCFRGTFPSMEFIDSFRPWNRP